MRPTVPSDTRQGTARLAPAFGLDLIPLPVDPGADRLDLLSLARDGTDPAAVWMRGLIEEVARGV
jgi:hypothetical protein